MVRTIGAKEQLAVSIIQISNKILSNSFLETNMVETSECPMDFVHMLLKEKVEVKLRHGRSMEGRLCGYDEHLNLMLKDAVETVEGATGGDELPQVN